MDGVVGYLNEMGVHNVNQTLIEKLVKRLEQFINKGLPYSRSYERYINEVVTTHYAELSVSFEIDDIVTQHKWGPGYAYKLTFEDGSYFNGMYFTADRNRAYNLPLWSKSFFTMYWPMNMERYHKIVNDIEKVLIERGVEIDLNQEVRTHGKGSAF